MKTFRRIFVAVLLLVMVLSTGGVFAVWTYPNEPPENLDSSLSLSLGQFEYIDGDEEMTPSEIVVTNKFTTELSKMFSNPDSTQLDEIVESRKDKGGWFAINELAADDPSGDGAAIRELLGLTDHPELTVIIKFVSGSPGYELYTTRVDVDAKDTDGNYIIPEVEFNNETTYIYPVNRTTFISDGKGGYVADHVSIGYSRTIYYYETPFSKTDVRTYDVSTWAEGTSFSTAVEIESSIVGRIITVQNIDREKTAYFKFTVPQRGRYSFVSRTSGLTGKITNASGTAVTGNLSTNTTYYLTLTYSTEDDPQHFVFSLEQQ